MPQRPLIHFRRDRTAFPYGWLQHGDLGLRSGIAHHEVMRHPSVFNQLRFPGRTTGCLSTSAGLLYGLIISL